MPYIGGSTWFPSWLRKDTGYRVLSYLIFRNSAHVVTLCEAHDEHGGIAIHQQIAHDHSRFRPWLFLSMAVSLPAHSSSLSATIKVRPRIWKNITDFGCYMVTF